MATVTKPSRTQAPLADLQRRVRHPLQRLRSYIRYYVSLEGLTVLLLYLTLWFWIGLALDYLAFSLFAVDWVQELPWTFRLGPWQLPVFRSGVLVVLVAGLLAAVAFKVLFRLMTEFRDTALALVLERRFPQLFGDRLITAVELADVRGASRYGYSPEMIELTIADAAERVDRAPVREVFNWRRLRNQGLLVGLLMVGTYLLVGVGACAVDYIFTRHASAAGFARLHDVSGMWFERNILLRDTLWPRRAFLELVGFPESGELRIGQESAPPTIRVRAVKWVIADPSVPDKWRALTWADLNRPELLGDNVPEVPAAWQAQRRNWTVDQVELQLAREGELDKVLAVKKTLKDLDRASNAPDAPVRRNPPAAADQPREAGWVYRDDAQGGKWRPLTWKDLVALGPQLLPEGDTTTDLPSKWKADGSDPTVDQVESHLTRADIDQLLTLKTDVLDRLEEINASGRLKRSFRKLVVPEKVTVISYGLRTYNTATLDPAGNNEFAGTLSDLKESVHFIAHGEDFYTQPRLITVVPPPSLTSMKRDEYRPAYLYYRVPADSSAQDLATRKQLFSDIVSSVSGGDTTRIQVPAGTDVVLTATVDKQLRRQNAAEGVEDGVRILPPRKGAAEVRAPTEVVDEHTFRSRFDNVHATLDFVYEFTDTDGVVGLRHVIIKPVEDNAPEVDAQVEVIRKTNQGYMVTPFALIPFSGKVRDDNGLSDVRYLVALHEVEGQGEAGAKSLLLLSTLYRLGGGLGQDLVKAAEAAALAQQAKAAPAEEKEPEALPVAGFVAALEGRAARESFPQQDLLRFLQLSGDKPYTEEVEDPLTHKKVRVERQHPIMTRSLFSEYQLKPEDPSSGLDMTRLLRGPKIAREQEIQPHYRMQVWMEATDTDIVGGPHHSQSKEKFTFQVVSVNDLLSEIAHEEEGLHLKLDDMANRLKENLSRMDQVMTDLGGTGLKEDAFSPMSVRAEEMEQVRDKSETAIAEVLADYQRILKEMDLNRVERVRPNLIGRVDKTIVTPLDDLLREDFPRTKEGLDEFRRALDSKEPDLAKKLELARTTGTEARARLDQLIRRLMTVLNAMEGLVDFNKIIKIARGIEEEERNQFDILTALKKAADIRDTKDLFDDDPKDKK